MGSASTRHGVGFFRSVIIALVVAVLVAEVLFTVGQPSASAGPWVASARGGWTLSELSGEVLADIAPMAVAGPNQTVPVGTLVTFNGSMSTGFEGPERLNYTWTLRKMETNTTTYAVLWGITSSHSFLETGAYEVNLTVRDSMNRSGWSDTFVVVTPRAKSFLEKYWLPLPFVGAGALVILSVALRVVRRLVSGQPVVTEAGREKVRLSIRKGLKIMRTLVRNPMGAIGLTILTVFIVLAFIGPIVAPYKIGPFDVDLPNRYQKPSAAHWLGTDNNGIDIFSELLYGARTSMIVGVFSAVIASVLGAVVGLYSGYMGGWKDEAVMRLNDVVLSLPWLVLMIVVAAFLGQIDLTGIILIIGLTGWSMTARMVRAQVLSIRERQYVERAKAIGASDFAIIRRHVFPNAFPLVFANTILTVAVSILSEATLSFLGLRPAGVITWGTMLSFASDAGAFNIGLQGWILAPGLCIVAVVLGFTLLGYALDEILNPKLRRR